MKPLKRRVDLVLAVLAGLLIASLLAFMWGIFPYPFGLIVLAVLITARIFSLRGSGYS